MDASDKLEGQQASPAAFVEGGIQDACDDSCSICLEEFCVDDPSAVTCCKHEFHLHCILEWCQRSSQCPMCWQAISLKDPTSQELLECVEMERNRVNQTRNASTFYHPALGNFELQHDLPVVAGNSELEERVIQHLAAVAAMGNRSHHIARREGHWERPSSHGHPQFMVFSSNLSASSSSGHRRGESYPRNISISSIPSHADEVTSSRPVYSSRGYVLRFKHAGVFFNAFQYFLGIIKVTLGLLLYIRNFVGQSSLNDQDSALPSDLQSFSNLTSRLTAVSMRYKDSITKSTRGWRERFFPSNSSMSDIGSEVRREVNAGIATVSRLMERLETRDSSIAASSSATQNIQHGVTRSSNERVTENRANTLSSSSGPN
ncbi:E3 ubiquitin-protein ligase RHF2A-like isoform X1 [Asparagus officinalis]|uniref:E3 ubiquitin-protein ligase RHF2A-like isoform X1 n=1 Tax=Asparagus officinalis TaxID=4686 RepID=UPI00098E0D95|nr:E3 ubiquitin-protein ligase RHF2A-like isoform X1 [Asparagus officinalis]XP_020255952.1 E3 ubiquitin-protein ligase RHF2A-like isoform X1 [Asparagus officinalis]XP_020255953.1 E3 ubiquitin-protein ligase RHF2A-like isoform X1 [Asparagus officinalis]